ncbi:MAG: type II secretion system F family protein, partial [Candidatus Hydrogenedentes bacterium]|nr:type II secretion system F family protein [Candidatus Hydrogenedentota bacterium]
RRTKQGRLMLDTFWLNMPIFGPLFQKAVMSRFASIFAILQSSGVNVLESIRILAGAIGNKAIGREFERINQRLEGGRGSSEPLSEARYFPPMVVNMIDVGEETGQLDAMLGKVADIYDQEVEVAVEAMLTLMEPIIIVVLGGIIGFIVISLYMPIFTLGDQINN